MNAQTVTSSLISAIHLTIDMAGAMKTKTHPDMLLALHEAVGPGGDLPIHYQLALLPINELDDLHTKVVALFRAS
jgi:hypothetical protein